MKKIISLISLILLLNIFTLPAMAAEINITEKDIFQTAGDLFHSWKEEYPDYICGVWSTDGGSTNLTFGVTNNAAGARGKQNILDLLIDDATVTFVYQTYSRNHLLSVQREIDSHFNKGVGLMSTTLSDLENYVVIGLDLKNPTGKMQRFMAECADRYGNAVVFVQGELLYNMIYLYKPPASSAVNFLSLLCILLILMICGLSAFARTKRNALLMQTTAGNTVVKDNIITKKQIIEMAKDTELTPSAGLDKRVFDEIRKLP